MVIFLSIFKCMYIPYARIINVIFPRIMKLIICTPEKFLLLWISVVIFLPPFFIPAHASMEVILDEENQLSFAEQYFKNGEYYRAIGEYERFLYFFPLSEKVEYVRYRIGISYLEIGQSKKAIQAFYSIIDDYRGTKYALRAYVEISRAYLVDKNYDMALTTLSNLDKIASDQSIRDDVRHRRAWIYLEMGLWEEAEESLKSISFKNQGKYNTKKILVGLAKRKYIKKKSPVTAGLLSIIPGAGHFYCERRKDALVSFLLNGAMILGAFEAFENDMDAFGGIITFFELGFYSGNIYSAVSSAHKYNRDEKSNFLRYLKESTGVRISADKFGKNNPLFISCQFLF